MSESRGIGSFQGFLTEGLLIAVVPVAAYLVTFAFEAGIATRFGYPLEWISLNLVNIFISSVLIFMALMPAYTWFSLGLVLFPPAKPFVGLIRSHPFGRALFNALFPLAFTGILFAMILNFLDVSARWWMIFVVGFSIYAIAFAGMALGLPLITQRDQPGYKEKLLAQEKLDAANTEKYSVVEYAFAGLGMRRVVALTVFFIFVALAYSIGYSSANRRKDFLVIHKKPELVVLRNFGWTAVCAVYDRRTGLVRRDYALLELAEKADPGQLLSSERIGPVRFLGE